MAAVLCFRVPPSHRKAKVLLPGRSRVTAHNTKNLPSLLSRRALAAGCDSVFPPAIRERTHSCSAAHRLL